MSLKFHSSVLSPVGLALSMVFLVNCQRARLEPQNPALAAQTQIQLQNRTPVPAPQAPAVNGGVNRTRVPGGGPAPIGGNGTAVTTGICGISQIKADRPLKVLFVVDGSGSNFGASGSEASDPNKKWRSETLGTFIKNHIANKNISYGLTMFKGTTAKSKINIGDDDVFSNNPTVVARGFQAFMDTPDGGNTPYRAALRAAKNMIEEDMQDNVTENASYAVVMVSDGHATDYKNANDVIPDASAIKDLAPERITLNSVYYSADKVDAKAPHYLKNIARIGEGQFVIANTHQELKLDDVIRVAGAICK